MKLSVAGGGTPEKKKCNWSLKVPKPRPVDLRKRVRLKAPLRAKRISRFTHATYVILSPLLFIVRNEHEKTYDLESEDGRYCVLNVPKEKVDEL